MEVRLFGGYNCCFYNFFDGSFNGREHFWMLSNLIQSQIVKVPSWKKVKGFPLLDLYG